jgi:hypothetical protein
MPAGRALGPLAAEEVPHLRVAFAEEVNPLYPGSFL